MDPVTMATIGSSALGAIGSIFGKGKTKTAPVMTPFTGAPGFIQGFLQNDVFPAQQAEFARPFEAYPMGRYDVAPTEMGYSPEMGMIQGFADAQPMPQAPMPQQSPMEADFARGQAFLMNSAVRSTPYGQPMYQGRNVNSFSDSDLAAIGRAQALVPYNDYMNRMGPRASYEPSALLAYVGNNPELRGQAFQGIDTSKITLPFDPAWR